MLLKNKISIGIIVLVAGLLALTLTFTHLGVTKGIKEGIQRDLLAAQRVFEHFQEFRFKKLATYNEVVANVPHLKAVVTTAGIDHATILDSAKSVQQTIRSDLFMICDRYGMLLASVSEPSLYGVDLSKTQAIQSALANQSFSGFWIDEEKIYQVVASPMLFGDEVVGALLTGFIMDQAFIEELEKMTNCQVSIWSPMVSPAPEGMFADLKDEIIRGKEFRQNLVQTKELNREEYLFVTGSLAGGPVYYVLARSLKQELLFYRGVLQKLLIGAGTTLLIALVLGAFYSRRITRPIKELIKGTQRITEGDLSSPVIVTSKDEIGDLTGTFNKMMVDLKTSRDELVSSERYLENIIKSMGDMLVVVDPKVKIKTVNPAILKLLGYEEIDLVGKPIEVLFPKKEEIAKKSNIGELLKNQSKSSRETFLAKDGKEIPVLFLTSVLEDDKGNVEGVLCVARDIREMVEKEKAEKRLLESQEQLRQSQKMEAIGKLAGGVAHDFNNILTAIIGCSEILMEKLKTEDPNYRYVKEVKDSAERAAGLTHQLLAFSRKQPMTPKITDINISIEKINKMLQRVIGENIELVTDLHVGLGMVEVDVGQIDQVLLNLAVNARDAMPKGGKLSIATENVDLKQEDLSRLPDLKPGPYVVVSLSDEGTGMSEETMSRIFEPFFTTKGEGKGTGLGLSTVYGIIKQNKAGIAVESKVGEGTTFKIYLPQVSEAKKEAAKKEEKKEPAEVSKGAETILLAEDEDMVRELARELLKNSGYTVLEASNGKKALDLLREHKEEIDMLLTDVKMPDMSGDELVKELTKLLPKIKVLFMSGYTNETITESGLLKPGRFFLQKPFTTASLREKVREVLDSKAA